MNRTVLLLAALSVAPRPAAADEGLALLPAECRLSTPESTQALLVQRTSGGEYVGQLTEGLEWSSSDPKVATVDGGVVRPVADGEATIRVRAGAQSATMKVVVDGLARPFSWNFREHVEPVFAKLGCNSGACHGALAGKGGFRLSLRGYDPATDYFNIVKQDRGRRVELADPGRSLLLAKPSGAINHKGGVRFATDSREYRILAGWIADGAAPPSDADPRVERLEVLPGRSLHRVGETQRFVVRVRYSDGRDEDVTRGVKWSSSDESVCRVDEDGLAAVVGPGEG